MIDETTSWETDLRAAMRRLRDEHGRPAVLGPAEEPAGPWVAFRAAGEGRLLFESDAGGPRELADEEAIDAAVAAFAAWGLVEADPLACFLEGVDRDPAKDDPYDARAVLKALGGARPWRRSLSLAYDGLAGKVKLVAGFPNWRSAELSVAAPSPSMPPRLVAPATMLCAEAARTGTGGCPRHRTSSRRSCRSSVTRARRADQRYRRTASRRQGPA